MDKCPIVTNKPRRLMIMHKRGLNKMMMLQLTQMLAEVRKQRIQLIQWAMEGSKEQREKELLASLYERPPVSKKSEEPKKPKKNLSEMYSEIGEYLGPKNP
jgi:hypothetical protein